LVESFVGLLVVVAVVPVLGEQVQAVCVAVLVERLCLDGTQKPYLEVEPDVLVVGGRRASRCGVRRRM
jgi:hypothetical protein